MNREELEQFLYSNKPGYDDGTDIYVYGTGDCMDLYQEGLKRTGLDKIITGYCKDGLGEKEEQYNGKTVVDISTLNASDTTILVGTFNKLSANRLKYKAQQKFKKVYLIDDYMIRKFPDEIMKVYDLLSDERSKEIYAKVIKTRCTAEFLKPGIVSGNQYLAWNEFAMKDIGRSYVDCGAYVGDTLEQFIWHKEGFFDKIYAIEPDKKNLRALRKRVTRLSDEWNIDDDKIDIIEGGVGNCTRTQYLLYDSISSRITETKVNDGDQVNIYALDDIINSQVSCIKADIESYEYQMIEGAKKIIQKDRLFGSLCG